MRCFRVDKKSKFVVSAVSRVRRTLLLVSANSKTVSRVLEQYNWEQLRSHRVTILIDRENTIENSDKQCRILLIWLTFDSIMSRFDKERKKYISEKDRYREFHGNY